jgi:hypothetical protein
MKHLPALALFALTSALVPSAQAEDILSILQRQSETSLSLPPETVPYSYTLTVDLTEIEGDDIRSGNAVLRIDPSQPAGSRADILSAEDPDSPALVDFLKEFESPKTDMAEMAEDFWCQSSSDADFDPSQFTVVSETETEAVLKPNAGTLTEMLMQSDDEDDMDKQERKMMKKLLDRIDGELILSKPDAQMKGFKVNMTRSMTLMIVAKIKSMEIEQDCAPAPNGHTYTSDFRFSIRGKALGTKFGQDMNMRISDLTPLP